MKPINTVLQMPTADPTYKPDLGAHWLKTPRNHQLAWSGVVMLGVLPTVTVELYTKWYSLWVVRVGYDEVVLEEFPFPDDFAFCPAGESPFLDHAPSPIVVARWAKKNGFVVDDLAMELMIGRWEREYRENYAETYVEPPEEPKAPCTICGDKGYVEVAGLTHPTLGQAINPCKCRLKGD